MGFEFYTAKDLSPLLVQEITEFLDSQDTNHPFQFPQWNASEARFSLMRESGSIRWFGSFGLHSPLGSSFAWMRALIANRGPVCDDATLWHAVTTEFAEHMNREHVAYLDVMPDWVQAPDEDRESRFRDSLWEELDRQRMSLRLSLTDSEEQIFANFRKNSRYEVRRAERLGVSVVPASSDAEMEEFLKLHSDLAGRKGFMADSPDGMRRAIRFLTGIPSRGALLLARFENKVYGGAVIAKSGKRCWYVWGASSKHEHFNVGHIVQWNALRWAKAHDCSEYDFGGFTPGMTSGPAWFKAGFGGRVVQFVRPRRIVLRPRRYRIFSLFCSMRGQRSEGTARQLQLRKKPSC